MKKSMIILACILLSGIAGFSQIGVNTDNSLPDNSAMLDVKSTTKGVLVPRMTAIEREAISNPAKGLLIFCIDDNQYYSNKGTPGSPAWSVMTSQWINNGSNIYYNSGNVGIGEAAPAYPLNFGYSLGEKISLHGAGLTHYGFGIQNYQMQIFTDASNSDISFGFGSSTAFTENVRIKGTGNVGIGTSAPNGSAKVEISSTTKGFLPPRMTTTQRDAIGSPAEGLVIYNTTDKVLNVYTGTSWSSVTPTPTGCGQPFIDVRNGQSYNTVQIGTQCWMAENLNVGDVVTIAHGMSDNGIVEKFCYNNDYGNCMLYGGLYTWNELMDYTSSTNNNPSWKQGICPTGWHLPSDAEWCQMETYLNGAAITCSTFGAHGAGIGGMLKETGTSHWTAPNTGGSNLSGFTSLPGGDYDVSSGFIGLHTDANFWTCTENSISDGISRNQTYTNSQETKYANLKSYSYSARCVKN